VGGTLSIKSVPGNGTTITVKIPSEKIRKSSSLKPNSKLV